MANTEFSNEGLANIGGWLFIMLAFVGFYLLWRKEGCSWHVLIAGVLAILAHQVLSALNILYGPFSFAELDAYSFHLHAIQRVDMPETKVWSIGSDIYKSLLSSTYEVFGKSLWVGQSFSIVFFALSCVLVMKLAKRYELNSIFCGLALLLFGLLPSSLLFGSLTLRETFFTYFFLLGVYSGYQAIYLENRRHQWLYCAGAMIAFILMGIFHMVLLIYAIAISVSLFFIVYSQSASWKSMTIQFVTCLIVVAAAIFFVKEALPVHVSDDYFAMLRVQVNGEVVPIPQAISIYHQTANGTGATTQYNADLEFKTWGRMFLVFMYSYLFYLGWPLTGDYSQLSTWVLMAEALVRLLGFCAMFVAARQNRQWYWLIFVYLSITFLWNIGTSNHGQALRHHFMTEWIPVLAICFVIQQIAIKKRLMNEHS